MNSPPMQLPQKPLSNTNPNQNRNQTHHRRPYTQQEYIAPIKMSRRTSQNPSRPDEFNDRYNVPMNYSRANYHQPKTSNNQRVPFHNTQGRHFYGNKNRSLTPALTNISEVETHFIKIEEILSQKNETLESQNEFLKSEIRKLYEREKKYREAIRKYKERIKFLKIQKKTLQNNFEELRQYVVEVINRVSSQDLRGTSFQQQQSTSNGCSKELIDKLKWQLEELNIKSPSFNILEKPPNPDNAVDLHTMLSNEDLKTYRKSEINSYRSNGILDKRNSGTETVEFNNNQDSRKSDFKEGNAQDSHQFSTKLSQSKLYSRPPRPITNAGKDLMLSNVSSSDYHNLQLSGLKRQSNQESFGVAQGNPDTYNFNDSMSIDQKIEKLRDESEALMYELKKSGNQDKDVKKKIAQLSRKIRELEYQKQKFSKINEVSTDL